MSNVSVSEQDGKADFPMLLITDLDHNYYSCLYSGQATEHQNTMHNIRLVFVVETFGYCQC